MTGRTRDFHIVDVPREPPGSLYATGWRPFAQVYGDALCDALVDALRSDAEFRRDLVLGMRQAAWWVRNDRWARGAALASHVRHFIECDELMQLAGFPTADRLALVDCLLHACVCDGCDLSNGARFGDEQFSCKLRPLADGASPGAGSPPRA